MPNLCSECGAHLPYDTYGRIRCEFCNAQNYVPIPEREGKSKNEKVVKKKSPATAAVLNFFFWGLGYLYLGKWWGIPILIFDILVILGVMLEGSSLDLTLNIVSLAFSVVLAWHAYKMAEEINS